MRSSKAVPSIAVVAMLIMMATAVTMPVSAQAFWYDDAKVTFEPAELFPGETYSATYAIDISAVPEGVTQLTISDVWIQYEWETVSRNILEDSGPRAIGSFPAREVFASDVVVPADQAKGDYAVDATIWAYTNGDPKSQLTHTFDGTVKVSDPIVVDEVTADPATGLAPQDVAFSVTASGGTGPYTYSWDFGDGSAPLVSSNSTTHNSTTHTYAAGGTFTARVTVTDSLGRYESAVTAPITIAPGVTVNITAQPLSGPFPLSVTFNSTVTNAAPGDLTYAWTFGDGGTSTEATPTHRYESAGHYNVTLKVTDTRDRAGTSAPLTIRVTASVNPIARISANVESGRGPLNVEFTSTVEGGTLPYEYLWNFGDGSTSTETNPLHTYSDPGVYVVWLQVTDSASRTNRSTELTITVESDTTMEVEITASNVTGTMPMTVSFNSTVLNGTAPYFYRWSFGDGVNSTLANPTHTYEKAGTYKVTLTVTDSNSNVTIAHVAGGEGRNITITVTDPEAKPLPSWVWIWSATAVIIAAVGAGGFLMMRRQRK